MHVRNLEALYSSVGRFLQTGTSAIAEATERKTMCESMKRLKARLAPHVACAERILLPVLLLLMRLKLASVFLFSGWQKLGYVLHGETAKLYDLFEGYNVPVLPVKLAAWMGMGGELVFGAALLLGLCTRFAALGILVMCAFIYHADQNPLAAYWSLIGALLAIVGAGKWSVDKMVCGKAAHD